LAAVSRGESEGLRRAPVESVDRHDRAVVVRLAGELDLHNVDEVRAALAQVGAERPERLVVDLAEVSFIDSTTLGALVEARNSLGEGVPLLLSAPVRDVRRALEVSGLDRRFEIYDTIENALAAGQ
jgi:anti-sigma B factor antagonist